MIVRLEMYSQRLSEICFIEGVGLSSNVYTLGQDEVTIVDTGVGDALNDLSPKLRSLSLDPKNVVRILLTHAHFDHVGGIESLAKKASPKLLLHEEESNDMETFGLTVSRLLDGDQVDVGTRRFEVIHTPGHTPGSICLYDEKDRILLSGDTVFPDGGFGRTDLPGGESRRLIESLERLTRLQVDFLLPGHMEPVTSNATTHLRMAYENAKSWL